MTSFGHRLILVTRLKNACLVELCTPKTFVVQKGMLKTKLVEDLVSCFQNFQNTFESSDDCTNVVNAPREPIVVKQDNPSQIDKCCCECGEALDGIFFQQCICNSCGKGAHIGYNFPPKVPIISNPKPCNQTMNNELPQTLPSFDSVPCCQPPKYTVNHPIFDAHNDFLKSQNELLTSQNTIMEQMTQLTSMCEFVCQIVQKKQEERRIEEEQAASAQYWKISACCDDDDDYDSAITPVLSSEEPIDSLSMGDKHHDTIPATESDEVIKSSVEDLVPIPSKFEGIPDTMCDVHLDNSHTPIKAKDHVEIVINSNDDISSSDDDSLHEENIEACPHHGFSELHQLDTFYNALNVNDQDSLNSAVGGNFLDKMLSDRLKIIESKSKVRQSRAKGVVARSREFLGISRESHTWACGILKISPFNLVAYSDSDSAGASLDRKSTIGVR
nr:reverse transcriptase domain-containing protein [Tanacetum cinerariifolium]